MSKTKEIDRKAQFLDIGAKLAAKHGATNVTRRMVAKQAKCADSLVAHYMGPSVDAQKLYARHAKKLGLALPTKEQAAEAGAKLRAHGPRKNKVVRKRSIKEVKAIKRNIAALGAKGVAAKAKKSASPRAAAAASSAAKRASAKSVATNGKTASRTKRSSASNEVGRPVSKRLPKLPPLAIPTEQQQAALPLPALN